MIEKGMWIEGNPDINPKDTSRINLNVIVRRGSGDLIPEPGFVLHSSNIGNNKIIIGELPLLNEDVLLFSVTTQGSSEIGLIDRNGNYNIIRNLVELNFRTDKPIHGVFYFNHKNERIIVFTDNYNPPRIINIDRVVDYDSVNKMNLFLRAVRPDCITGLIPFSGDGLSTGAYYPIFQYESSDFGTTDWFINYNPVYVNDDDSSSAGIKYDGCKSGIRVNKAIECYLQGIDGDYARLNIGYIYVKDGVYTAYKSNTIKISDFIQNQGEITLTITENQNNRVALDLSEIQKVNALYKTVGLFTNFQGELIGADVNKYSEPNQQAKVNNLLLRWNCTFQKIIDIKSYIPSPINVVINNLEAGYKLHEFNNRKRTFMAGEVYAFYVQFEYKWGFGKWYPFIGEPLTNTHIQPHDKYADYKKYQLDDTCEPTTPLTANGIDGKFGVWENQDEFYPATGNYPTGKVRHFKFPSLQYLRNFTYCTDVNFGVTHMPILGIKTYINLNDFLDSDGNKAIGFRIGYARRDNTNSSTLGQSITIINQYYEENIGLNGTITIGQTQQKRKKYIGTGGNYVNTFNPDDYRGNFTVDMNRLRLYPVELLVTKNNPNFNFIRKEYELLNDYAETWSESVTKKLYAGVKDYATGQSIRNNGNNYIYKVVDKRYIPHNIIDDNYDNLYQEEYLATTIDDNQSTLLIGGISSANQNTNRFRKEKLPIITLLNVARNYYMNFYNQKIVDCGINGRFTEQGEVIYGGDTYICDMSVNTYGRIADTINTDIESTDYWQRDNVSNGTRNCKRFIICSQFNMSFKFKNDSVIGGYTDYYPIGKTYLNDMKRDVNANDWINGYNRDFNVLNDIEFSEINNPMLQNVTDYWYRIIKSRVIQEASVINAWRKILGSDYYDMVKNRGRIVNLVSDKDAILIHTENSLFKTRSRQTLVTDQDTINIGVGEIFANKPIELLHDTYGSLGTQHKFSCIYTPFGYAFVDGEKGKIFLVNESVKDITGLDSGFESYFFNNLNVDGDNPYTSNGIVLAYDEHNKLIYVTRKAKVLKQEYVSRYKGIYQNTVYFIQQLKKGDIVFKDGKYRIVQ